MRFHVLSFVLACVASTPLHAGDSYQPTFVIGAPERTIQGFVRAADAKPVAGAEVVAIATPRP